MAITRIDKKRKRQFAYLCIAFSLPIIFGFTIVDFIEGDALETVINIVMVVVFIAGFLGIWKLDADLLVYRSGLVLLSTIFLYNIIIGSGNGTSVYWLFPFPLVFVFLLGKREGAMASAVFFSISAFLLINPFSFEIYSYSMGFSLRFIASLLLVTLLAYGLEASREKYGNLLIQEHEKVLGQKKNLETAMGEIKILSGLIPICSNCKKVRDDKGYWQQVEIYVRDRSNADFSHGICPDCVDLLYAEYRCAGEGKGKGKSK